MDSDSRPSESTPSRWHAVDDTRELNDLLHTASPNADIYLRTYDSEDTYRVVHFGTPEWSNRRHTNETHLTITNGRISKLLVLHKSVPAEETHPWLIPPDTTSLGEIIVEAEIITEGDRILAEKRARDLYPEISEHDGQ